MIKLMLGKSSFYCKYLFLPEFLSKSKQYGIKLYSQVKNNEIDENLVQFVCENIVVDWGDVYDLEGNALDFDHTLLYDIFEQSPSFFNQILVECSKIDNFELVA